MTRLVTLVFLAALAAPGCAKAPPTLTPAAAHAYTASEVQSALDVLRDAVQTANASDPVLMPDALALQITNWHETTVTALYDGVTIGWAQAAIDGLTAIQRGFTAPQHAAYDTSIATALAVLKGFAA